MFPLDLIRLLILVLNSHWRLSPKECSLDIKPVGQIDYWYTDTWMNISTLADEQIIMKWNHLPQLLVPTQELQLEKKVRNNRHWVSVWTNRIWKNLIISQFKYQMLILMLTQLISHLQILSCSKPIRKVKTPDPPVTQLFQQPSFPSICQTLPALKSFIYRKGCIIY